MINFFIPEEQIINYDNVDESKSRIRLQKINGIYFIIYEFQKFLFTKDESTHHVVIGKFLAKENSDWKQNYLVLEEKIMSLINNYMLPCNLFKKRKFYNMKMKSLIFNNNTNIDIVNKVMFTQEGFDLITNKFLFTEGLIERTLIFDDSFNHYDDLVKEENFNYFKEIEEYYYNYFLTDNEIKKLSLEQILDYVDYNKSRLENVIIANSKKLQEEYFLLDNWKEENLFLVSFIDSKIELDKNKLKKLKKSF